MSIERAVSPQKPPQTSARWRGLDTLVESIDTLLGESRLAVLNAETALRDSEGYVLLRQARTKEHQRRALREKQVAARTLAREARTPATGARLRKHPW